MCHCHLHNIHMIRKTLVCRRLWSWRLWGCWAAVIRRCHNAASISPFAGVHGLLPRLGSMGPLLAAQSLPGGLYPCLHRCCGCLSFPYHVGIIAFCGLPPFSPRFYLKTGKGLLSQVLKYQLVGLTSGKRAIALMFCCGRFSPTGHSWNRILDIVGF